MYRQKNTVGNLENVGFAREGHEGIYNIYMMEEIQSIFAVGAGAVSKLVDCTDIKADKRRIVRIANPKYPYEYLREMDSRRKLIAEGKKLPLHEKTIEFFAKSI